MFFAEYAKLLSQGTGNGDDVLMSAAKRYQVDAKKVQKAVAQEFDAKIASSKKAKSATPSKNGE